MTDLSWIGTADSEYSRLREVMGRLNRYEVEASVDGNEELAENLRRERRQLDYVAEYVARQRCRR